MYEISVTEGDSLQPMLQESDIKKLQVRLLTWFDATRRDLPWREGKGIKRDPYKVWLAEIMLQQTTVATVMPRYQRFLDRWPTVIDLAAAPLDDVLHEWQGLGYYARARNLHQCATVVANDHRGLFPETEKGLRDLPGIGDYTAAAIAAIAFGEQASPVDGNIIRVLSRLYCLASPMPAVKAAVQDKASVLTPKDRPGDFAEALMDLGATICMPKKANCPACPWTGLCQAEKEGAPETYPVKAAKKAKPIRKGWAIIMENNRGEILLQKRPEKGLLGGMDGVPTTDWLERAQSKKDALKDWPALNWQEGQEIVRHTFTHFHLELKILSAVYPGDDDRDGERHHNLEGGFWCPVAGLDKTALPTVMKKVLKGAGLADRVLSGQKPTG